MNSPDSLSVAPRRSYRKWIIGGMIVFVAPMFALAAAAWSMLTLDRVASLLRREMMAATGSDWHTKVQLDVGSMTLGAVRTAFHFMEPDHADEIHLALSAVSFASVGVYERGASGRTTDTARLFSRSDKLMRAHGWTRLVGVVQDKQNVLIYTSDHGSGDRIDLCLAVVDGKELVVVSTRVDAEALMKLVEKHAPGDLKSKLKLAKLDF